MRRKSAMSSGTWRIPKPEDAELSNAFMDYWVQFAKTGNPNTESLTDWSVFRSAEDRHLVMDKKDRNGQRTQEGGL